MIWVVELISGDACGNTNVEKTWYVESAVKPKLPKTGLFQFFHVYKLKLTYLPLIKVYLRSKFRPAPEPPERHIYVAGMEPGDDTLEVDIDQWADDNMDMDW